MGNARRAMSSNSPGAANTLKTVKTLLNTGKITFSHQNRSTRVSVLKTMATDFSLEGGNFSFPFNATSPYETAMVQAISPVYLFFTPCLVTFGIIGNMLSIYVFCKSPKLRQQSSSQYLCVLAASDSVFLLQLLPAWLSTMGIDNVFYMQEYCTFFVYLSYVTCTLSTWLVLAFTVERCIVVLYPLHRSVVCTVKKSRYIILALTIGSVLFNLPIFQFTGTSGMDCGIAQDRLEDAERFNWADTTLVFTIPLLVILGVNIWIAVAIIRFGRLRLRLMRDGREAESRVRGVDFPRLQRRITNMLLLVSSVFFLFNVPAYVMRLFAYSYDWETSENSDMLMALHIVSMILFYSTFGINFFLYCLSGLNFRRALVQHVPFFGWLGRQITRFCCRGRCNTATNDADSSDSNATATCNVSGVRQEMNRPRLYRFCSRTIEEQETPAEDTGTEFMEMQEMSASRLGHTLEVVAPPPSPNSPEPGPSYLTTTHRPTVSRRITLSRVVTLEESKYGHLIKDKKQYTLSGAEKRKAMSHLYD